jgi:hypothetical protein
MKEKIIEQASFIAAILKSNNWEITKDNSKNLTFFVGKKDVIKDDKIKKGQAYIEEFSGKIRLTGYYWNASGYLMNLQSLKMVDTSILKISDVETEVSAFMYELN